ncbi:hypothetical protein SARC_09442 [Sphaeroforma arctica JP610]|uniref:Uncharacterized protein n=1 Tax=Sphaeroforma arctica JP610 TaxID=667725 RepID=A0A0L0FMZ9_9EUKA|nr:hypothetical protein SARC_09442 [Sphaeroforma arctica JP610]KNC78114.1 hypothetical protein SARC_09442 [Sphaeroforma arctica JP610]|eukprot:XP_014152016.1 hypothetical protein SARC_09442 [Sphaeroforma arctica JP610]
MRFYTIILFTVATLVACANTAPVTLDEISEYADPVVSDVYEAMEFDTELDESLTLPSFGGF